MNKATILLQQKAWMLREKNFPASIQFDYPTATRAVRLTGTNCVLNCAHCGGHYLKSMLPLDEILTPYSKEESDRKYTSFLVSGACDQQGRVPFLHKYDDLVSLKKRFKINMHVGLIDLATAKMLPQVADVISFDFVSDLETIKEVYGISKTGKDYLQCFRLIKQEVKVLPHICIGLKGGEIVGEYEALEILQQEKVDGLVFIVFTPTKNTRYAYREPPQLDRVINILAKARLMFPHIPIHLGCMRPKGKYREQLDQWAIRCGVNKIVMPTRGARETAELLGLEISTGRECCTL